MTSPGSARRDPGLERRLRRHLRGSAAGRHLYAFRRVASTMDVAHALAEAGAPEATLIWAARQDQGRGRWGRAFESPEGGVYCSLILRPNRAPADLPQLSLVAGLAVADAIRQRRRCAVWIRWPNDVLVGQRKVAGILVEARSGAAVVGIGVNLATDPRRLPAGAASLAAAGAPEPDRYQFTAALCRRLEAWYRVWVEEGFAPIRGALRPRMAMLGRSVRIRVGSSRCEGMASDLDEAGRLLVRLDSGAVHRFDMGDVTLLRSVRRFPIREQRLITPFKEGA